MTEAHLKRKIRRWIIFFIVMLILSGITAFPIRWELQLAEGFMNRFPSNNDLSRWYFKVYEAVNVTWEKYPLIAYGTDWLVFSHIVIAVAFIGILKDPVRNKWVVQFGMIACIMVFPLALISGHIRGIPWFWQLIDGSFCIFGFIPLAVSYNLIRKIEKLHSDEKK